MRKYTSIFYFVILSILASGLNYLTYPILGRVLGDEQFINVAVALSLLTQIATVLLSVVALTIGLTKEKNDNQKIIEELQAFVIKLFILVIVIFTLFSPIIFKSVHLPLLFIIPMAFLLIFSIPTSVFTGYLNGKKKLVKVGMITLITSSFQFTLTIFIANLSKNGITSLVAMSIGQLLAIYFIVRLFKDEKLPKILQSKNTFFKTKSVNYASLFYYTVFVSLGILAVNILQVIDLLIITANEKDASIYTDIYVVSRAIFFGGMIFVWPYLSAISVHEVRKNIKPTLQLLAFIFIISLTCIVGMWFFGDHILNILMGTSYTLDEIRRLSVLAILYKFFWLGIMALTLYFTILRSRLGFYIPLMMVLLVVLNMIFSNSKESVDIVFNLNAIALFGFIVSLSSFWYSLRSDAKSVYTNNVIMEHKK